MLDSDLTKAINLLKDDNLVWSGDFESIRIPLAGVLVKATQVEYHHLEPEITELCLRLISERESNARELGTTGDNPAMQSDTSSKPAQ
jgi:hypothetical protein